MSATAKSLQTANTQRKIAYRHILKSPYVVQWSQPQENLNDTVLDIIGDLFNKLECSITSPEGPIEKYGSYFRVGLNNVTAALEKRELAFVLITVPNYAARGMFEHLPPMCVMRGVPIVALSATGARLGKYFRLRTALAVGFTNACLDDPVAAASIAKLTDPANKYSCVTSEWVPALPVTPVTPAQSSLSSLASLQLQLNKEYSARVRAGTTSASLKASDVHNGPVQCARYGAVGQSQRKRTAEGEAAKAEARKAKKVKKASAQTQGNNR